MRKSRHLVLFVLAVIFFVGSVHFAGSAIAADELPGGGAQAGKDAGDPFAELLSEQPIEVIKTGPSCQFIRIQLPPGVTLEDLQGLPTP